MPEPTILVTGFEPFGGMSTNPTEQLVDRLRRSPVDGVDLATALLPVTYDECVTRILAEIERVRPAAVISCGLYAGRTAITPERIAINVKDTMGEDPIADNAGRVPVDERIAEGPDGLFTTLPIRAITDNLLAAGIPTFISNSAGTFICNNTMYGVLHRLREQGDGVLGGFIHFPASTEMALTDPTMASLPLETMEHALRIAVQTVAAHLADAPAPSAANGHVAR